MLEGLRLTDLGGKFLKFTKQPGVLKCHDDYYKAQGVWFQCPLCKKNSVDHAYTLLFPSAPEKAKPDGRWNSTGTSLEDLTLFESIRGECGWRAIIRSGEIMSTVV